jgi:hypothetical protein
MATYIPNATQTTEPTEDKTVESAALEFRTLKTSVNSRITTEITDRTNADTNLQGQINSLTGSIVGGAVAAIVTTQEIVGDGVTATYTLSAEVNTSLHVDLYIDGAHQQPSSYTVVLDQLTLLEVPHIGALITVKIGKPIGVGTTDALLVEYTPAGTGAVPTTVQAKLRESVSVLDFGAVGDGSNETAKVQLALDSLPSGGGDIQIAAGVKFNLTSLTFPAKCNLIYRADDDLSSPGQASDIGSGEWVHFSYNSSYTADPTGGVVNEWRFTAPFHPGIFTDVRKDVDGANAYLAPGQSLVEPVRASWNIQDEQINTFTVLYQNYSSNSKFAGVTQNTYRRVVTLTGVGTGDWTTLPSLGNLVEGVTSGAAGFFISTDATTTVLHWFSGKFVAGETLRLVSPLTISSTTVSSVSFTNTSMQPLAQDLVKGNWSIGLPAASTTHLFTTGGKIAVTQSRAFGQYDPYAVVNPAYVWHDLIADVPTNGFEITYNTTPAATSRRLTLRKLGQATDRSHIGAVFAHGSFNDAGAVSASAYNIASITKNGTGDYTVNFTNAAVTADYSITLSTRGGLLYAYVFVYGADFARIRVVTTGTSTLVDVVGELFIQCMGGDI